MLEINEHISKYTLKYAHKIDKLLEPLTRISHIKAFFRYTISPKGAFTFIGNTPEWNEEYYANHYFLINPLVCHPKYLQTGSYFSSLSRDDKYLDTVALRRKKLEMDHDMIVIEKTENGLEAFGFATHSANVNIYHFYHNEMPLLKSFIAFFKQEMAPEISSMDLHPANLALAKGRDFFQNKTHEFAKFLLSHKQRLEFYQELGLGDALANSLKLTIREKQIMKLVKKGKTAQEIANSLFLSRRTVESHVNNLKFKLHCHKKSELIATIQHLEQLGLVVF